MVQSTNRVLDLLILGSPPSPPAGGPIVIDQTGREDNAAEQFVVIQQFNFGIQLFFGNHRNVRDVEIVFRCRRRNHRVNSFPHKKELHLPLVPGQNRSRDEGDHYNCGKAPCHQPRMAERGIEKGPQRE